jgi:hypothetical protein
VRRAAFERIPSLRIESRHASAAAPGSDDVILLFCAAVLFAQETAVEKDGVRLSLDAAPSFGGPSLAKARTDKEGVRIGRLSFAKPGWFMNASVPAGDYRLVIEAPRRALHLSLRTDQGETVASDVFWIEPPDPARPKPELAADEGAVVVTISCNDIRLTWRWVPKDRLEAAATGARRAGKHVELISDLGRPELEAALLQEVDAAAETQAALIGRPPPTEPIRIHLLRDEKTYAAVDKIVTGGRFLRNGGFASPLTRQTYIWYASRTDPADVAGVGAPLILRATLLHEFHHVLCYAARPESVVWPSWLSEGLAEEAATASLGARNPADADAYRDYTKGRWRHSESVGSLPTVDDLLGAYAGSDLGGWYSSAFTLVSRLGPDRRRALLDAISAEELSLPASVAAREYLDLRAGGARTLWDECRRELLRGDAPPLSVFGQTDRCSDGFRITSSENGSGRLILQDRTYGPDVVLEARIAWQPSGERQADFFLAYVAGKEVTTFLKVAVLPKRVVLFRFIDNRWLRWGQKDFPDALADSGDRKAWHSVRLQLQGRDRRLAVEVDQRKAEFSLPEYVPSEETRVGVGVYNSTVYFSDVRAK